MSEADDAAIEAGQRRAADTRAAAEAAHEIARKAEVVAATSRTVEAAATARSRRADADVAQREADAAEAEVAALVSARDHKAADVIRVLEGKTMIDVDADGIARIHYPRHSLEEPELIRKTQDKRRPPWS